MSATFWDNFEYLKEDAKTAFIKGDIDKAVDNWQTYFEISAIKEWRDIAKEARSLWEKYNIADINSISDLFTFWENIRSLEREKKISSYLLNLVIQYIAYIYNENFKGGAQNLYLRETGIIEYLSGNYSKSAKFLQIVVDKNIDDLLAKLYLGWSYLYLNEQKKAIEILSENLFYNAEELRENDFYLSQFKMLYGKLHSQRANHQEAVWLLVFEAWYRNWLVIKENESFYKLMRQKEFDERIYHVKYYLYERYRHFVRCLYVAEYNRLYNKDDKGVITEVENYMKRLDPVMFEKYRKKRKPLNLTTEVKK